MELGLTGKVAVVTGGSRGIGRAIAVGLAAEGCAVAVNYVHNSGAAAEVVATIEAAGGTAFAIQADVSDSDDVVRLVETVVGRFETIDVLVNNGAIYEAVSINEVSEEAWDQMMAVNLKGPFLCVRAVMPIMEAKGWGRIINVASNAGKTGSAVEPHYAASKAGLINLTRSLARHLAPHGITVNCVAPGSTDTEMFESSLAQTGDTIKLAPLGRIATPDEVASTVIYLASEPAAFITGETINVNGGSVMD